MKTFSIIENVPVAPSFTTQKLKSDWLPAVGQLCQMGADDRSTVGIEIEMQKLTAFPKHKNTNVVWIALERQAGD